ncbi:hypothetical protein M426DRAFT_12641 [Hypoxylon sp. CI-4A]|nr:hypothetical protein M426DRAFT_12641 [Hypoxylon sp. CI-4A]
MTGVRTSKRCEYCRGRKIKVCLSTRVELASDLKLATLTYIRSIVRRKWPTCGACKRTSRSCSGPPKAYCTFIANSETAGLATDTSSQDELSSKTKSTIINNVASKPTPEKSVKVANGGDASLLVLQKRPARSGQGNYLILRAHARPTQIPYPTVPPQSREGLLASRLVQCISAGANSDYDIRLRVTWLDLVVSRLETSSALYEATNLLLNSWTNFIQDPKTSLLIDRATYVKALNILYTTLSDPSESHSSVTLAAVALLYRVELDYDMTRGANQSNHAAGLIALMTRRGPPHINNELYIRLCFENLHLLVTHMILDGRENFFGQPEWFRAMKDVVKKKNDEGDPLNSQYELSIYLITWVDLVKDLRAVNLDRDQRQAANLAIRARATPKRLYDFDTTCITRLLEEQHIQPIIDPEAGFLSAYEFDSCGSCQVFHQHARISVVINRVLQSALRIMDIEDLGVDARIYEYCERIWKTLPYIERKSRTVRDNFIASLIMSLEAADEDMRQYLVQKTLEIAGPRAQLVEDPPEASLLALARALTGR